MSRPSSHSPLHAQSVVVACALALLVAMTVPLGFAPSALAAGGKPGISGVSATNINENGATLEAEIDPQGSETTVSILLDPVIPPGACPDGCGSNKQYEPEIPTGVIKLNEEESAKAVKEYEAKHAKELEAQHAKEQEEQAFMQAAARAAEVAARKQREEREQDKGGLSLTATSVTVQRDGTALVKLECLGIASCRGKLMLTAKVAPEAKGRKKPVGAKTTTTTTTIGTVSFSIAGDETKTVKVDLNAAGRALLNADHGRVDASLQILELAPGPGNTQTKAVRLLQQQAIRPR